MMRKIRWMLLVLFVFGGDCQDQPKVQEPSTVEQKQQPSVAEKPFTTDDPDMKEIIWKKDEAEMVLIRICSRYLERKVIFLDTKICSC